MELYIANLILDIITSIKYEGFFLVRVEFLGPILQDTLELEITNLSELAVVLQEKKELSEWLENCAVAVNDTLVSSLECELKDGDKVSLLPPVCGG